MKKKSIKTTTLSALVAVSKTESGMDYVQVMPDNPSVGLVQPFCGMGRGQLLSNGSFDFIRKIRIRNKPLFKTEYATTSCGMDKKTRFICTVPFEIDMDFPDILEREAKKHADYMRGLMKKRK